MVRCSFCQETVKQGTGKIFVKKDGKMFNFCAMKCEKNMIKLGRKAVKYKWTRASRKVREQIKGGKK